MSRFGHMARATYKWLKWHAVYSPISARHWNWASETFTKDIDTSQ
jgi:hypothetical protein